MSHELVGLLGLAGALLATVLASTWRFSSLASKLLAAVQQLERKDVELEARLKALDAVPQISLRVDLIEKNTYLIPDLSQRVKVLETKAEFSKEMRALRRSNHDGEE